MKKKYGLLFLLCLLMFFCVNIDGAQARLDEGGGGTCVEKDVAKDCLYKGLVRLNDNTFATASVAINYSRKIGGACTVSYHAVKHSNVGGGTDDIHINNIDDACDDEKKFYKNCSIQCPHDIYLTFVERSTTLQYRFSYNHSASSNILSIVSTYDGDAESAADEIAEEGQVSDPDSSKNQDMTDDIKKQAEEQRKSEDSSGIDTMELNCSQVIGDKFAKFLKSAFLLISIAGIVLLIVLASLDFIKVITASEDNAMSEAFKRVKNRILAVIILLLLPLLVNFLIDIINDNVYVEKGKITIGKISDCSY